MINNEQHPYIFLMGHRERIVFAVRQEKSLTDAWLLLQSLVPEISSRMNFDTFRAYVPLVSP